MLQVENLENRILLAPIAPFDVNLLAASDTGSSTTDGITSQGQGTLQLTARTNSVVNVSNHGVLLGTAVGQNDTVFYETNGTVVIDAEMGVIQYPMRSWSTYIRAYSTAANPAGSAAYQFYLTTPGVYYVRAYVNWYSAAENSIFVNIDDTWQPGDTGPALWSDTVGSYHAVTATTEADNPAVMSWDLEAGWHTFQFYGRENYAYVNRFAISTDIGANPNAAISTTYETYQYTFAADDLDGSESGAENSITATAVLSGTSPVSSPLILCYDTGALAPAAPDLAAVCDTGLSQSDAITHTANAVFTGTAETGATVWLRVGGENRRSTTADGSGNYSVTAQAGDLAEGANLVDIYYVDRAGNISPDSADLSLVLDRGIPIPAVPDLAAASDSGRSHLDNLTNISEVIVSGPAGAAEALSTVWLRINGADCTSTMADMTGAYSFTLSSGDLAEGDNLLDVYCIDTAGNISSDSADLAVTLDTTAPIAGIVNLQPGSDTGVSNHDHITSLPTPTVEGTTEPFALVDLYLNGGYVAQLTASAEGYWSCTFATGALVTGTNEVSVRATDLAGNLSASSAILQIILESEGQTPTTPALLPGIGVITPAGQCHINHTDPQITGNAAPDSIVQILVAGMEAGTAEADESGNWTFSFSANDLAEGLNQIEIISTDPAGNVGRSAPLLLTVDTIAPVLQRYYPCGSIAQTVDTLSLFLDTDILDLTALAGGEGFALWGAGGDGSFGEGNEYVIPIAEFDFEPASQCVRLRLDEEVADDAYRLVIDPAASLRDWAGNPARAAETVSQSDPLCDQGILMLEFSIDTVAPAIPAAPVLAEISDSGRYSEDAITCLAPLNVRVSAEAGVSVEVFCNGSSVGLATEIAPGIYATVIPESLIREGPNQLAAQAADAVGNQSVWSSLGSFVYDSTSPAVADIEVNSLYHNQGPGEIRVIFSEANIDAESIVAAGNYRLVGAGGDGIFGNGNETEIHFSSIAYHAAGRAILLSAPQTATGISAIEPDRYRLMVLAEKEVTDLAGNGLAETAVQEFWVVPAAVLQHDQSYHYTDESGHKLTVRLSGPGQVQMVFGAEVGSANKIETILVTGTTEETNLKIQSSRAGGTVLVGEILIDGPLNILEGKYVQITGRLVAEGQVHQISLGSIAAEAFVDVQAHAEGVRLTTGSVGTDAVIQVDGHLAVLHMASFAGSTISAGSAGKITIQNGDMQGNLNITEGNLENLVVAKGDFSGRLEVASLLGCLHVRQGTISADVFADAVGTISCRKMADNVIRSAGDIEAVQVRRAENISVSAAGDLDRFTVAHNLTGSTVAAGRNCGRIIVRGDCLDNMLLAGADLGVNGRMGDLEDQFGDGNIELLKVRGSYRGTIAATAIHPGADFIYFTDDDFAASSGYIGKVRFTEAGFAQRNSDHKYGLICTEPIPAVRVLGQTITAPFELDWLCLRIIAE